MNDLKIINPGGYTTIQDKGRFGFQHMGIPVSGALDTFAFTLANLLVGNPENAAVMELTVMGPSFEIRKKMELALTGARMGLTINGISHEQWRSIPVKPGDIVSIGQIESGCRSYLAFRGGISVPDIMGSASTYVGGQIGGLDGGPLKKGDRIQISDVPLLNQERILPEKFIPVYPGHSTVRAVPGPQDDYFDEGLKILFETDYMVTAKADRMGYRLQGNKIPIKTGIPKSIISEPAMPGSIQIPADEQPIILLVEQTVGGYAKIATVVSFDLPVIAQSTPGDTIGFEKIDLRTAHNLFFKEQKKIHSIKKLF